LGQKRELGLGIMIEAGIRGRPHVLIWHRIGASVRRFAAVELTAFPAFFCFIPGFGDNYLTWLMTPHVGI
jgi:hypothetical protein